MRPLEKRPWPTDDQGAPKTYSPYGKAKDDLIDNLGPYCSFCEREGYYSALDVEHIQPKGLTQYAHLEENWDNFLLGCKNCNPIKGDKDVVLTDIFLPHQNNTVLIFEYLQGGLIQLSSHLTSTERKKAKRLMDLVGLDRRPGRPNYSTRDKRWQDRMNVYNLAERYLGKYENGTASEDVVVDLARASGFWSVWMCVFDQHAEVKNRLIAEFPGTCMHCFDVNAQPLRRNGNEI